tara:strand:- start:252 stop:1019 length:768 start_codon:yes stop_codon:yes gene_type:complete
MTYESLREIVQKKETEVIADIIELMVDGKILILKDTFSKQVTQTIKSNTKAFWNQNKSSFYKMNDGCPNYHRIIDDEISQNYSIKKVGHTTFFFPWNKDDLGVREIIMDRWRVVKEFTGLDPYEYERNIPSEGTCDRIQVVLYPPKCGLLETHSDPFHNQLTFASGYLSTRGAKGTYEKGGFYAIGKNGNKIDLEENIVEGDFAIGLATIKHGVEIIDPDSNQPVDWYGDDGRWFLGLYSNDSDNVKNRRTAKPA